MSEGGSPVAGGPLDAGGSLVGGGSLDDAGGPLDADGPLGGSLVGGGPLDVGGLLGGCVGGAVNVAVGFVGCGAGGGAVKVAAGFDRLGEAEREVVAVAIDVGVDGGVAVNAGPMNGILIRSRFGFTDAVDAVGVAVDRAGRDVVAGVALPVAGDAVPATGTDGLGAGVGSPKSNWGRAPPV